MKVKKDFLKREIDLVCGIIERRSSIPVLQNVHLTFSGDELNIVGTDLDVTFSVRLKTLDHSPVAKHFIINAHSLKSILPHCGDEVEFQEADGAGWDKTHYRTCRIISNGNVWELQNEPHDRFPDCRVIEEIKFQTDFNALAFRKLLEKTTFAATSEASRFTLSRVNVELGRHYGVRLVATDGHRLAMAGFEWEKNKGREITTFILNLKAALFLQKRMLKWGKTELAGKIEILDFESCVQFSHRGRYLIVRKLSGVFPNYQPILNRQEFTNVSLTFNAKEMIGKLKARVLLKNEWNFYPNVTNLSIDAGKIVIETSSFLTYIEAKGGKEQNLSINAKYLMEGLQHIKGEAQMDFSDKDNCIFIENASETLFDYQYVVMPFRELVTGTVERRQELLSLLEK